MDEGALDGGEDTAHAHHLKKRSRRNKSLVVVFDPDARKEYVTGFQKRKNQRRKVAEAQKAVKDRQKRLAERKERRMALEDVRAPGPEGGEAAELTLDADAGSDAEDSPSAPLGGTLVYEDVDTLTTVTTCSMLGDEDEVELPDAPRVSSSEDLVPKTNASLQPAKKRVKSASKKKNSHRKIPLKSSKRKKSDKSNGRTPLKSKRRR